jgi:hypothetical protein
VAAVNAPVGVYTLTESSLANYTAGTFSCSGGTLAGNQLTIAAADAGNTITCTITNTFTPNPAKLGLAKNVVNNGGGSATAAQFTLTATGPTIISGPAPVAAVNAPVGVYTLTESSLIGYTAGLFSCSGGGTLAGNLLTIAAADAGKTITCTITNTFNPAKLGLVKNVVNTGGGTASASAFTLTATSGSTIISGPAPVAAVNAPLGVYTLTESSVTDYTAGLFSCSGGGILAGNLLTIAAADAGKTITCTITNTYTPNPAKLGLAKIVVNNGVGTATAAQFTLTATGPTIISGPAPVTAVNAPVGVYTLTESSVANYTAGTFICSGGGTLAGNLLTIAAADAGKTITCTITNTFNPAKLGLVKNVVNNGVGIATAAQFTLTANGPTLISGPAPVAAVNAPVGVYRLTETNLANYTAGTFSCSGGGILAGNQLTVAAGDAGKTITCTVTNTFNASIVPSSIPTLSEWAMIILASLLAVVGFAALRRQEVSL